MWVLAGKCISWVYVACSLLRDVLVKLWEKLGTIREKNETLLESFTLLSKSDIIGYSWVSTTNDREYFSLRERQGHVSRLPASVQPACQRMEESQKVLKRFLPHHYSVTASPVSHVNTAGIKQHIRWMEGSILHNSCITFYATLPDILLKENLVKSVA